ncbi:MAG: hypothetical protein R2719_13690 [Micropruina sp.]
MAARSPVIVTVPPLMRRVSVAVPEVVTSVCEGASTGLDAAPVGV